MLFWHGGNLNNYNESVKHKKGKHEFGPGLYATTHFETAQKYAKGGRKLYLLNIEKGTQIEDVKIPLEATNEFIQSNVTGKKRKEVQQRLSKYNQNNQIPANIFLNIILNEEAIKSSKMNILREFLVNNGADYELVNNAFGWGETMIVLYNMNKISESKQIKPKDKIKVFDLKDINNSENIQSIIANEKTSRIARILYIAKSISNKELTLYHGTDKSKANKIKSQGLKNPKPHDAGWYMVSTDFNDAASFAYNDKVIVEIKIPLKDNEFWEGYPHLWPANKFKPNSAYKGDFYAIKEAIPSEFIKKIIPIKTASKLVSIFDVVDEETLKDPKEQIYDLIDPEEERNYFYEVKSISPEKASTQFKTMNEDVTVLDAFEDFAKDEQKEIVDRKMKLFDKDRVIITSNNKVVDGNHHLIAAIKLDKPILYIDLQEPKDIK